ncbi:hypothetical protein F5Y09DRAFT_322911 [Xylaria sp. FL1042]|nr:hypothetical protein F5Y09DRAFT_322911 [Xylaria sp. FL1042]
MQGAFETTAVGILTIVLGWVLTALALLSLILYIWSKRGLSISFDDILLYLSFLISLALMSLTTWAVVVEGQGQHQSAESRSQIELVAKSLLVNEILWSIVNTFLRIAPILFVRKISGTRIQIATIILLVVSVAYFIVVVAISLAICQPIRAGWNPTVMGKCGNEVIAYLCLEVISLVLDLAIVPTLMGLQMSLSKRWGLCGFLSLGSVVFIITALRIAALNRVTSKDFSYDRGYLGLLSILGPLVTIVCCCITSCTGVIRQCWQMWSKSWGFSSTNVIWSRISAYRSRWRSTAITRKNHNTEFTEVISRVERLKSVSTSELSLETRHTTTTREQPATQTSLEATTHLTTC